MQAHFFKSLEKQHAILLYRFAVEHQFSISRQQKFHLLYPKFSSKFQEFNLKFKKTEEVAKNWVKLKPSRKRRICGIRGLMVNRQVNYSKAVLEESPFDMFCVLLTFSFKRIVNKTVSGSNFGFINSWSKHCFLKLLKKWNQFCCVAAK